MRFFAPRLVSASLVLMAPLHAATPSPAAIAGNINVAAPADAEQKAAEAARIDALYQAKKATLSPARQAWEAILEQNLGDSFYLPLHKREFVKGVSTAWDFVEDNPKLPRVLLIGDSISRAYTLPVRTALANRANVHRAPENCGPTANGLKKIELWLGSAKWDVIVFNFGIHDRNTPSGDYEARLEQLTRRLVATRAKLIFASSTPLPENSTYGSDAAIVERNAIAARVMRRHGVHELDLYAAVAPRLGEFQRPNDVHFSSAGYEFLGEQVSTAITRAIAPSEK